MRKFFTLFFLLPFALQAQIVLIKQINPTGNANPNNFIVFNGAVYFTATDGTNGYELWKTDGTSAGTVAVTNNPAGDGTGQNSGNINYAILNGWLYFNGKDLTGSTVGFELFRTNGSTVQLVKDINPATTTASGQGPTGFYTWNNKIYFTADDGTNGDELWVTDGTAAGTVLLKDISPGVVGTTPNKGSPTGFIAVSSTTLLFRATTVGEGTELWKTDGTETGTVLVKDIFPGTTNSAISTMTFFNNKVWFAAKESNFTASTQGNNEVWFSDGTTAGTQQLLEINTNTAALPIGSAPFNFTVCTGKLFFSASNGNASQGGTGTELWSTDGTAAGTAIVKDINTTAPTFANGGSSISGLACQPTGSKLFFTANDGTATTAGELYSSDGTAAGTGIFADINPTTNTSSSIGNVTPYVAGNNIFFNANGSTADGTQLWYTQGSTAVRATEQSTGNIVVVNHNPRSITDFGQSLVYAGVQSGTSFQLYGLAYTLPVRLLGFDAIKNGQHALLQWQTADENNNKGFAIERSVDGVHFDQIGWVNAVVNPGSRNNYSFNDLAPVQGWNYYRFKQIDLDGKFTYSPQRKLLFAASSLWSVVHPVRHELWIRNNFATAMTINIFDAAGKQVLRTVKSPAAILRVNVASLQSGLYFVQLNGGAVQKFVKD